MFQPTQGYAYSNGGGFGHLGSSYGSSDGVFTKVGSRKQVSRGTIVRNTVFPWLWFLLVSSCMCFWIRYRYPLLTHVVLIVCFLIVLAHAAATAFSIKNKMDSEQVHAGETPLWSVVFSVSLLLAWLAGALIGDVNFTQNMRPYYDLSSLASYAEIDPAATPGQQLMDAAQIQFSKGTHLDRTKAMSFRNINLYCVAPIASGNATDQNRYDYWAVGTNCCEETNGNFGDCGSQSYSTRSALKLLNDDTLPFYRLAVQQAEATYHIKAAHPMFYTWVDDPFNEMVGYQSNGLRMYMGCAIGYLVFQMAVVMQASFLLAKM